MFDLLIILFFLQCLIVMVHLPAADNEVLFLCREDPPGSSGRSQGTKSSAAETQAHSQACKPICTLTQYTKYACQLENRQLQRR